MGKNKDIFQRKEKKYRMTISEYEKLLEDLLVYMEKDNRGLHTISSLYYDTDDYSLIRHSIEKPIYKEKFRIRCYGNITSEDKVFIELKKKFLGVVNKRRISLKLSKVNSFINSSVSKDENSQISREIKWFLQRYDISPKVMIAYDRIALFSKDDPDFRVTFDFNIRWRGENLDLSKGSYGENLIPQNQCMMEIKTLGAIPIWLCNILTKNNLYSTSFSKYGSCYKNNLFKKGEIKNVS